MLEGRGPGTRGPECSVESTRQSGPMNQCAVQPGRTTDIDQLYCKGLRVLPKPSVTTHSDSDSNTMERIFFSRPA